MNAWNVNVVGLARKFSTHSTKTKLGQCVTLTMQMLPSALEEVSNESEAVIIDPDPLPLHSTG